MRNIESLTMVLILGVLGAGVWAAYEWLPASSVTFFHSAPVSSKNSGAGLAGKPATKVAKASGKRRPGAALASSSKTDFQVGDSGAITNVDLPTSSFPFPSRNDFQVGTTRFQILAAFGEPTARVTTMRSGRIFERFYYLNKDRTQVTVATLEEGAVVRGESAMR